MNKNPTILTVPVKLTFELDADGLVDAICGILGDSMLYGGDESREEACRIVREWWPSQKSLLDDVAKHIRANQCIGGGGWVESGDELWYVARYLARLRCPRIARNLSEADD